jgi:hypothetical protein
MARAAFVACQFTKAGRSKGQPALTRPAAEAPALLFWAPTDIFKPAIGLGTDERRHQKALGHTNFQTGMMIYPASSPGSRAEADLRGTSPLSCTILG